MSGWHIDWNIRKSDMSDANSEIPNVAVSIDRADTIHHTASEEFGALDTLKSEQSIAEERPRDVRRISRKSQAGSDVRVKEHRLLPVKDIFQGNAQNVDEDASSAGGKLFGILGFVLLVLALAMALTGVLASLGWTSLGLIIMATMLAVLAFVFALISFLIFRNAGEGVPWYVWTSLIIGGLAVLIWLRVLLDKG